MNALRKDFDAHTLKLQREFQRSIYEMRDMSVVADAAADPDGLDVVNKLIPDYHPAQLGNLLRERCTDIRSLYKNTVTRGDHPYQLLRDMLLAIMREESDYKVVWSGENNFRTDNLKRSTSNSAAIAVNKKNY